MWLAIALAAAGFLAIVAEVFLPTAGVVGAAGLASIVAGIVVAYQRLGATVGSIFLAAVAVLVPTFLLLYFKLFPRSFMGRWLINRDAQSADKGFLSYSSERYSDLLGKEGKTLTVLRPVGMIMIGDKKYSASTGGEYIEKDLPIRIIKIEGNRIVVRRTGGEI